MPTQSSNNSKAKATKPSSTKKSATAEKNQVQAVAESAVDFPVGAALAVRDGLTDLVEPWTSRGSAEKQIQTYRTRVRKSLKRTERRGTSARRKAATEARKTRNRVEREARRRQRSVEGGLKRSRTEVEQRVRRAIEEQTNRAQDLLSAIR